LHRTNYRDHAAESNMPIPERPIVFSKFTTSIVGPDQPIILPDSSEKSDYEAELAVIIGRRAKSIAPDQAFDYVLGYTNLNDISERSFHSPTINGKEENRATRLPQLLFCNKPRKGFFYSVTCL
jgi:2-keto-4-pentenoate hydratase/2-oxohepta-3-ene-1,7-dioic acid hydratase in catechol pathway